MCNVKIQTNDKHKKTLHTHPPPHYFHSNSFFKKKKEKKKKKKKFKKKKKKKKKKKNKLQTQTPTESVALFHFLWNFCIFPKSS